MEFSSKLIEAAVQEIAKLPGIGKKTAFRLVLHLLKQKEKDVKQLAEALTDLREGIQYCQECGNVSDKEVCDICLSPKRDRQTICVVENFKDIFAIENTAQYRGLYHVLGGLIAPMDGITPNDLRIEPLLKRIPKLEAKEVILALSPTKEGDTTAFYLTKKLKPLNVKVSTIARGVPIGGELEYTDEITLGRSIQTRITYE
ncbi:MAG: recombination mediator RecR [Thermonemataceae bacterium]